MGPTSKWHFVSRLPNGSLEICTDGILVNLEAHNFVCKPPIEMMFKAKLVPLSKDFEKYVARHLHMRKSGRFLIFNDQESNCRFDFWPFFGHNVCFRYPNGSCKPILNIYVFKYFQYYMKLFNPLGFDPCNFSLKIQESILTFTPNVGAPLGV
jgi:hypothetical protein